MRRTKAKADGNQMTWACLNKELTNGVKDDKRKFIEKKCEEMNQSVKEVTSKWMPRTDAINEEEEDNALTKTE